MSRGPKLTPTVVLGYRIMLGADVPALSAKDFDRALTAAHRHQQYHEIDNRRIVGQILRGRPVA